MKEDHNHLTYYLQGYIVEVEKELGWGSSIDWRHQDFISLSEKIYNKTGVQLSVNTLKRIWGRINYKGTPNTQTLDTLAQFLGYENWLSFKNNYAVTSTSPPPVIENFISDKEKKQQVWLRRPFPVLFIIILSAIGIIYAFQKNETSFSAEELANVTFSSRSVTQGVPNTVVFNYDVSHLEATHVEIQQSWDAQRRFNVSPDKKEATSFYYYPGYWRAKLLVNGQILKEKDVFIPSEGWLSTLDQEPQPRYFFKDEMADKNHLGIASEVLKNIHNQSPPQWLGYHYIDDFGSLHSDNFSIQARFKNTYFKGDSPCQESILTIVCTTGFFSIPFSRPGCVGELKLWFNDKVYRGKDNDLSAFGCSFDDWQNLRFEVKNKKAKIYLNGNLIQSGTYTKSAGNVVGLRFEFMGAGIIDDIRIWGEGNNLIFEDTFNKG